MLGWEYEFLRKNVYVKPSYDESFVIDLEAGQAVIKPRQQGSLNSLKRAYSKQALRRAAKLQNWQIKSKGQLKGVIRR